MKTKRVRPILVESKVSTLHISHGKLLTRSIKPTSKSDLYKSIPQELILISLEDEEIKVGEIGLDLRDNTLFEVKRILTNHYESGILSFQKSYCKKVIAHQSQISPEYISKFVEQYNNGSVEDLEIEMEHYWINSDSIKGNFFTEVAKFEPSINQYDAILNNRPKLINGFVTIVEKEPIRYIEKEVRELLKKVLIDEPDESDQMSAEDFWEWFDIWFEQNKKK